MLPSFARKKKPKTEKFIARKFRKHRYELEKCFRCGGTTFFVVHCEYRHMKGDKKEMMLPNDVQFFCQNCGTMNSGIEYNRDLTVPWETLIVHKICAACGGNNVVWKLGKGNKIFCADCGGDEFEDITSKLSE